MEVLVRVDRVRSAHIVVVSPEVAPRLGRFAGRVHRAHEVLRKLRAVLVAETGGDKLKKPRLI
jgi:hypothetical protein